MKKLVILLLIVCLFPICPAVGSNTSDGDTDTSEVKMSSFFELGLVPKDLDLFNVWAVYGIARKMHYDRFRPDFKKMVQGMADGLARSLDDFSCFHNKDEAKFLMESNSGSFAGMGIVLNSRGHRVIIAKVIARSPAEKSGLKENDICVSINGKKIKNTQDVVKNGRGPVGTKVELVVKRNNKLLIFEVIREKIEIESVAYKKSEIHSGKTIAFLEISGFDDQTPIRLSVVLRAINKTKPDAVVLDLRDNPGGLITSVSACASMLIKSKSFVFIGMENGDGVIQNQKIMGSDEDPFGGVPVVCLINYGTASAGEVLAACLHDVAGITLIGEQTFGKGSVQSLLPFDDGTMLRITTAHWYTPEGVCIHEGGIAPDIEILGREEQDREAIEVILEKLKNK